jgi:hypothetical protein
MLNECASKLKIEEVLVEQFKEVAEHLQAPLDAPNKDNIQFCLELVRVSHELGPKYK